MQTQLTLNPPTFMWFTFDSLIHLSEENPGPLDIEFSELPREHQYTIILGVKNRQIKSTVDIMNLLDVYKGSIPNHTTGELANVDEDMPQIVESDEDRKQSAMALLTKTPTTIKKNIENSKDIRALRIMLELELTTRNRTAIISALQSKLEVLFTVVQESIAKDSGPALPSKSYIDPMADAVDIVESEVEKIIFTLPEETEE